MFGAQTRRHICSANVADASEKTYQMISANGQINDLRFAG